MFTVVVVGKKLERDSLLNYSISRHGFDEKSTKRQFLCIEKLHAHLSYFLEFVSEKSDSSRIISSKMTPCPKTDALEIRFS